MESKKSKNKCTVCGKYFEEDNHQYYCEDDGTSILKRPRDIKVRATDHSINEGDNFK